MRPGKLNLDLLFRVPGVPGFDVAKDGKSLAFNWNMTGQHEIYIRDLATGNTRQVTSPPESKAVPRFSPVRRELVYSHDFQGDELYDIFLVDLETGKSRNITPNTPESISPFIDWSPDGNQIALSSNRSGKFSIYTINRSGSGAPKLVHDHEYIDGDPFWSPDGRKIMFTSLIHGQDQGVFITRLSNGDTVQVSEKSKPLEASEPDWSPDGKSVAFVSAEKGMSDVAIYNVEDGSLEWLTNGKYEAGAPTWSPKGDILAYHENRDGNVAIVLYHTKTGKTETVQVMPGIHYHVRFSHDDEELFFLYNGPKYPSDLWSYSLGTGEFKQLTRSLPNGLDTTNFVSPSTVAYKSQDGRSVPALLYKSRNSKERSPAVVYVHGGPTSQFVNSWNPLIQEYLDRGFTVIAPNYRGSTGYGREFREANRFVMGQLDLDDVAKSVDYLVEKGLADSKRIAITGGSFGGYLTMCALTKYPDLWAAGSAIVPFLNWFTEIQNERDDLQYWDRQNMGDPEKDMERLRDASPIFFIGRIKAPVQMIAGAHDPRCPPSETLQARDELRKHGKMAEVVIYEDEGHGFLKLDNRLDAYRKNVQFLSEKLAH